MSIDRIYELFEQIVSRDRFGHCFHNQMGVAPVILPVSYQRFVAAQSRHLPSNWQLYSYFGHETVQLDTVRRDMLSEGISQRWLVFGKTGDEDFLVFDQDPPHRGAVIWCDANQIGRLEAQPYYAANFRELIVKVTRSMAMSQLEAAQAVLAELNSYAPTSRAGSP